MKKIRLSPFASIKLTVIEEEIPRSHTEVKTFEDVNSYVSEGRGGCYDDTRPTVSVELKRFGIHILGGQSLHNHLKQFSKEVWWTKAFAFAVGEKAKDGTLDVFLFELLDQLSRHFVMAGRNSLRSDLKKLLRTEL